MTSIRKIYLPLLVFVGGAFVGPLLYWVMPLLPRYDLLYYVVGPLIWPIHLLGPLMDSLGADNYVALVGLNVLLYAIVGTGIVVATRNDWQLLLAGTLLEVGVFTMAFSAVQFRLPDLLGDSTMLIALLIVLAFYGSLVLLVRLVAKRTLP